MNNVGKAKLASDILILWRGISEVMQNSRGISPERA